MPARATPRRTAAPRRAARRLARLGACGVALCGAFGACAGVAAFAHGAGTMLHPVPVTSTGLELPEQARRDRLVAGRWDTTRVNARPDAEERGEPAAAAPNDDLLRDLDRGTAAFYAGRWRASVAAFARASALADDRETKRVSRGALALATNDRALPYMPGQNERLFVHYYAALAYLHAGALEDAAVEARRMSLLLQRYDAGRDTLDLGARAALRYVAGAVFEAAGATNDADVAYRNAAALGAGRGTGSSAARDVAPGGSRTGSVVVVVERGFVAHRVGERLRIWTSRHGDAFASVDTLSRRIELALHGNEALWAGEATPELRLAVADDTTPVASPPATSDSPSPDVVDRSTAVCRPRVPTGAPAMLPRLGTIFGVPTSGQHPIEQPREASHARRADRHDEADAEDQDWRLFTLAWPAYRRPATLAPVDDVLVDARAIPPLVRGDLSLAIASDFKRDRSVRLARLVARAALRATLVHTADHTDRSLGDLASALGNVIERADTRSWHLLPADLTVGRLRLSPGLHTLAVDMDGRRVPIGTVRVEPRTVQIVSARVWNADDNQAAARVIAAGTLTATP